MTAPAAGYDELRATRHRARLIRAALPRAGRAVEIGPGNGWLLHLLDSEGWDVTAYEGDPARAANLADRFPSITVHAETVEAQHVAELVAGYDAAFALSVLHHFEDPRTALEALTAAAGFVVVEVPDRIEAGSPDVAGSDRLAVLYDLVAYRRPSILGWSPSAWVPGARRPLCVWDADLVVGTVTAGNGWSSRQWPQVGARIADALAATFEPGTLNLELDRPLPFPELTVSTDFGPAGVAPVTVAGVEAWAVSMPESDRGPLFTELVAGVHLRAALELRDGDRVPVRTTLTV